MNAGKFLVARSENGTILVSLKKDGGIAQSVKVHGSNFPVSLAPGKDCDFFYITPEKGKEGFVALSVACQRGSGKGFHWEHHDFIVPVSFVDVETPEIKLEQTWIPPVADRLPSIYDRSCLEVVCGTETFSAGELVTHRFYSEQTKRQEQSKLRVLDPTLLCRFLVGEIDLEGLRKATVPVVEEKPTREELLEQVASLTQAGDLLRMEKDTLVHEKKKVEDALSEKSKAMKELVGLHKAIQERCDNLRVVRGHFLNRLQRWLVAKKLNTAITTLLDVANKN